MGDSRYPTSHPRPPSGKTRVRYHLKEFTGKGISTLLGGSAKLLKREEVNLEGGGNSSLSNNY